MRWVPAPSALAELARPILHALGSDSISGSRDRTQRMDGTVSAAPWRVLL
jgi:hypothetical protein